MVVGDVVVRVDAKKGGKGAKPSERVLERARAKNDGLGVRKWRGMKL